MSTISLSEFLSVKSVQDFLADQLDGDSFGKYFTEIQGLINVLEYRIVSPQSKYFFDAVLLAFQNILDAISRDESISVIQNIILFGMAARGQLLIEEFSNEKS